MLKKTVFTSKLNLLHEDSNSAILQNPNFCMKSNIEHFFLFTD